jgi:hypothetical protein
MRNADRRRVAPLRGHTPLRWRGEGGIRGGSGKALVACVLFEHVNDIRAALSEGLSELEARLFIGT